MKAVLDTNVLVSALIARGGTPARILRHPAPFRLVTAEELLAELAQVLHYEHIRSRYRLTEAIIQGYLQRIRAASHLVEIQHNVTVVEEDPDDDRFVACALTANADYLVSGDKHLLRLSAYAGIAIVTPAAFLHILDERSTT